MPGLRRRRTPKISRADLAYVDPLRAARVLEPTPAASLALWLMLAVLASALAWSMLAEVDVVARATARVIPEGREQLVASLEGGILRELKVREGDAVQAGQELAVLDPTRMASQRSEGQMRRLALRAAVARAQAEAEGRAPQFPPDVQAQPAVMQGETASFKARRRLLDEALESTRRNLELLRRELGVAESMSAQGLMSEVEVMRVRRQVNDLEQLSQERISRFRQEAAAELVRLRNELAQIDEQMVVRDDALARTVLRSPVRGIVKSVRNPTLGGIVTPGAPLMEIVPQGETVLVELRIKPSDIGFVQPGQAVHIKLSAYEYTVYGGLRGQLSLIGPDAIGDADRGPDALWYRAFVRADTSSLRIGDRPLPVRAGMQGTAEIRVGQRTVMSFMLRPLLRTREAFRER